MANDVIQGDASSDAHHPIQISRKRLSLSNNLNKCRSKVLLNGADRHEQSHSGVRTGSPSNMMS